MLQPAAAQAQTYPTKPLTLLVTVSPGGSIDVMARTIAQELGKALGQPVVVENRPGAGGNIAAGHVARAPADGYTLMITSSSTLTINPHVYLSVPFDPVASFEPVVGVGRLNMVLVVSPAKGVSSLRDFTAWIKNGPSAVTFGSSGIGSLPHLAAELLTTNLGGSTRHVPYKGLPAAMTDVLSGEVGFMFDSANAVPHIKAGKLVPIAAIGPSRLRALPDLATFKELGIDGMEPAAGWYGIFAPAGTPAPIVQRLNTEIRRILSEPEIGERWVKMGIEQAQTTPAELGAWLRNDAAQHGTLIKRLGLPMQ
ncbi:MAG: Bug family tripartite tricarboxylate transporter substrate binding protein [Burkholderiaceae bacterium]